MKKVLITDKLSGSYFEKKKQLFLISIATNILLC